MTKDPFNDAPRLGRCGAVWEPRYFLFAMMSM
jgi:hypothetical protein